MSDQSNQLSVGNWFWTIFLTYIPLVGLIMLFVWGFSSTTNPAKQNWAKAMLIFYLIAVIFYFLAFVLGLAGAVFSN